MDSRHGKGTRVVLELETKNHEQFRLVLIDFGARPSEATAPGLNAQKSSQA